MSHIVASIPEPESEGLPERQGAEADRSQVGRHVLVVIHHLRAGGAQRQSLEFATDLAMRGNRVTVYTFESTSRGTERDVEDLGTQYPNFRIVTARIPQVLARLVHFGARLRAKHGSSAQNLEGSLSTDVVGTRRENFATFLSETVIGRAIMVRFLGIQLSDCFSPDDARGIVRHCVRSPSFAVHVRYLANYLNDGSVTELVSFLTKANCVAIVAGAGFGIPVVVSERNDVVRQNPGRGMEKLRARLYPHARLITANTKFATGDLAAAFPDRNVAWLPNSRSYRPRLYPKREQAPKDVCVVSRLEPQKRIDEVIRAFELEPLKSDSAKLHIFGSGSEQNRLRSLTESLGLDQQIIFHGFVPVDSIPFENFAVFVSNSEFEGSSNSLHEAVERGLIPVVAMSVRELTDILPPDALKVLQTNGSPGDICEKVVGVLDGLRKGSELPSTVARSFEKYWKHSDSQRRSLIERWC